jgi:hypothetical protein
MLASTHRLTGTAAGLSTAIAIGATPVQILLSGALASVTAAGVTSPDIDQQGGWKLADKLLPDEWLGHGGPFRHRGLAHWWGLPVLAAWFGLPAVPDELRWFALALLVGWISHLLGDFLFGKANRRQGRGPGIPVAPWWWYLGIGLDTGGSAERFTRRFLLPGLIAGLLVVWAVGQGWLGTWSPQLAGVPGLPGSG